MNDKLSNLDTIPVVDRASDLLYIVDTSAGTSNKATPNELLGITGNPVGTTDIQTLTQKTLTSPTINTPTLVVNDNALTIQDNSDTTKKALFELSGITTGTTRTYTLPNRSDTLVDLGSSQTLTSKTLTAPTITNPTLTVDTISEFTSANGVTIDGLNIKDSALVTANSVPNSVMSNTGAFSSAWAWTAWTPTFANMTVGNGVISFFYAQVGKVVMCRGYFTFGTTSAMGTSPTLTLPVTAKTNKGTASGTPVMGVLAIEDNAVTNYVGTVSLSSSTVAALFVTNSSGTYLQSSTITSTVPMTWGNGDEYRVFFWYESA